MANPEDYIPFGLPSHEGVDIAAATGSPVTAVAVGTISQIHPNPSGSNYGIYIRVNHGNGYETTYAHLQSITAGLAVGTAVSGGQQLGRADSTGNSQGSHLHLTLKRIGFVFTDRCGRVWPFNIFDPEPYMQHFTGVTWPTVVVCPTGQTYDLAQYILGTTDGRATQFSSGETLQYQASGGAVYLVKNSQWEQFRITADYIDRGKDTSPGPAPAYAERPGALRWYWQRETGQDYARWCARRMHIGQTWAGGGHHVQFYYKSDCVPSSANSGNATNRLTLTTHYPEMVIGGLSIQDVIEMQNSTGEAFWFARGWGMVAWTNGDVETHAIELFQPGQRSLTRESGCFS
jgi:hypothetical protein